jgi:RNA polymerase sigma-70 factor (ECF subfamily)
MGAPAADHEDLVQEVFVVVHRRLPHFDGENLSGWLYQIARYKTRDFNRLSWVKHFVRRRSSLPEGLSAAGFCPADSIERKEKGEALARLLRRLNPDERSALLLFEIEGYSGERIARIQSAKINTVWARIYRARKKLKAQLSRMEPGCHL